MLSDANAGIQPPTCHDFVTTTITSVNIPFDLSSTVSFFQRYVATLDAQSSPTSNFQQAEIVIHAFNVTERHIVQRSHEKELGAREEWLYHALFCWNSLRWPRAYYVEYHEKFWTAQPPASAAFASSSSAFFLSSHFCFLSSNFCRFLAPLNTP